MKGHSKALKMEYTFDGEKITFDDGVIYTIRETLFLSKVDDVDIRDIHFVKKLFNGELLTTDYVAFPDREGSKRPQNADGGSLRALRERFAMREPDFESAARDMARIMGLRRKIRDYPSVKRERVVQMSLDI